MTAHLSNNAVTDTAESQQANRQEKPKSTIWKYYSYDSSLDFSRSVLFHFD
jgi:hypothetical protein